MNYVGHVGASTHAYTQQALIEKTIDRLSRRASIVGALTSDEKGRDRIVKTSDIGEQEVDIANTSIFQTKEINVGDEARFTLVEDITGLPTHGRQAVRRGNYMTFKQDLVRLNLFDTPEVPMWSEMDLQRFANMIANMPEEIQKQIAMYLGTWTDISAIQAMLMGADRGLLYTGDGGLGMQLMNAPSAGYSISCKNTYVAGTGMVTWNATRATFEASVGHAIYGLTDTTANHFSLTAHEIIQNQLTSVLRFPQTEALGKTLTAVCLCDPWIIKRLITRNTNNAWFTLMRDADIRGPKNSAIDRDRSYIIDGIAYIPVDWLRAFRATGADNVQPTYGAGLTSDPQTYIETADTASKKCCAIYLSARAMLHATSTKWYGASGKAKKNGRFWITPRYEDHDKGAGWAGHMKIGFKRYEPQSNDGTSSYRNNNSLVAWFYDAGPGVSPAS